jgi:prepilin-type N-terminal cleavage/methylation domain-containing protein
MNDKGFTILELMVTLSIGLLVLMIGFSSLIAIRGAFLDDLGRLTNNQNARGALDIIGIATREAGENLDAYFPAIVVEEDGSHSRLTIRRNLLDEVLKLCTQIDQGSNNTEIFFAVPGTEQGCIKGDQVHNLNAWNNYRTTNGGEIRAYLYDSSTKQGEFFTYISEVDSGDSLSLVSAPHTWAHSYSNTSSAIYILEEWVFQMNDDTLQIVENGETDTPLNVAHLIEEFKVETTLNDNTIVSTFTPQQQWSTTKGIRITITSVPLETAKGKSAYTNEVSALFFPRNILSH